MVHVCRHMENIQMVSLLLVNMCEVHRKIFSILEVFFFFLKKSSC